MNDLPTTIVAGTVWAYWACVIGLVIRSHLRFQTAAGAVPHTAGERRMWWLWIPVILLWQVLPLLGANSSHWVCGLSSLPMQHPGFQAARAVAAGIGVLALVGTVPCWLGMGRDWSMAVVPRKRCRLITTGMFARVRHPIYALSILLMLATIAAVPTPAMIAVGLVHVWMLHGKATSEEHFLRQVHGQEYAAYCRRTGRFLPRIVAGNVPVGDEQSDTRETRRRAA